ncbi:MAG TPA: VWA domain-containing protein [Candidatus Hydrogenedentes bacterium]|nr:VWA domain-containing protein [Candidatus Hydrogenedentota bacterium]
MFGIEFGIAHPLAWLAFSILLMVCLYIALNVLERHRKGRIERFVEAKLAPRLLAGLDNSARKPLGWLTLVGVAALLTAIAQPHWGQSVREIRKLSRDFVVLIDTSESMRAENPLPSRMVRAKQEISALLDKSPGDRFALIPFSGDAQLLCPLTLDHGYFRTLLNCVDTDTVSIEGTNIAEALDEAIELLKKEDEDAGVNNKASRAILLISDGEQLDGDGVEAARRAADYARIFVLGIGDPDGATVQVPDSMLSRFHSPEPQKSRLDEDTLTNIALAGGGAYARSRADSWDIDELHSRFATLSTRDQSSTLRLRLINRYQWPLAVAVAAFAAEGVWIVLLPLIRGRRMRNRGKGDVEGAEYA